jgi:hypothetical protein
MKLAALILVTLVSAPGERDTQLAAQRLILADEEPGGAPRVEPGRQRWLPSQEEEESEPEPRSKVLPGFVLGASVLAGIAGTVFLFKTMNALERTDETLGLGLNGASSPVPAIDPQAIRDQQRDVLTNGIATTMFMSASIAGLVTSTVLLLSD